jgi:hypothetical protein
MIFPWGQVDRNRIDRITNQSFEYTFNNAYSFFFFFLCVSPICLSALPSVTSPLVTRHQYVPKSDAKKVSPSYLIFGRCRQDDIDSEMEALRARRISIYIRRSRVSPHENKRLYFHFKWHYLASLIARDGSTTVHIAKRRSLASHVCLSKTEYEINSLLTQRCPSP